MKVVDIMRFIFYLIRKYPLRSGKNQHGKTKSAQCIIAEQVLFTGLMLGDCVPKYT